MSIASPEHRKKTLLMPGIQAQFSLVALEGKDGRRGSVGGASG